MAIATGESFMSLIVTVKLSVTVSPPLSVDVTVTEYELLVSKLALTPVLSLSCPSTISKESASAPESA